MIITFDEIPRYFHEKVNTPRFDMESVSETTLQVKEDKESGI